MQNVFSVSGFVLQVFLFEFERKMFVNVFKSKIGKISTTLYEMKTKPCQIFKNDIWIDSFNLTDDIIEKKFGFGILVSAGWGNEYHHVWDSVKSFFWDN